MLTHLNIRQRLWLLVSFTLMLIALLSVMAAWSQRDETINERRQKTVALVDGALTLVRHYGDLADSGKMDRQTAQDQAKAAVSALRYDGDNYFFIVDTEHRMVRHPIKLEMDGQDLSAQKDANGVPLFIELVATAKRGKREFVDYVWPRASGSAPQPKVSTAALYAPWNWVVGTGLYIDDVDAKFRRDLLQIGGIFLLAAIFLLTIAARIVVSITRPLGEAKDIAQRIADGDLSRDIVISGNDEVADLQRASQSMQYSLRTLVGTLQTNAANMASMSAELATTTTQLARSSDEQAQAASSMASSVEEMSVSISQVSDHAREVSGSAHRSGEASKTGRRVVNALVDADTNTSSSVMATAEKIRQLGNLSDQISSIVSVIREVADQTNLLALNAAIEAARAGEQGRGFAVVADEVRKLAERTAKSTTDIGTMIEKVQIVTADAVASMEKVVDDMGGVARLSEEAGDSIREIDDQSQSVLTVVGDITLALREQTAASQDIARRVEQIAQMTEENSAAVRQTAHAADQLKASAVELQTSTSRFRVR